jgi:hypothetical protein
MRTCVIVLTAIFVLSGCAALKNTPQQDYVWDAANAPPGWHDHRACMDEQMKAKPYGRWLREQKVSG